MQDITEKPSKRKQVENFFNSWTSTGEVADKMKLQVKPDQLTSMRKKLHHTPEPKPVTNDVILTKPRTQSCG